MVQANAHALAIAATALLAALPVQAGLYSKSSPVIQIDGKNYDRLIAQSNYTSIVEFYAPWCGHCKNLQPAYEKAAKSLEGLAKVAAVDCDEESNKQFCGGFGIQGFPTLKLVKPGKTPGKPIVEDYNGPRTAKGIADAVADKIPNLVKRVDDDDMQSWLDGAVETPKVILFTEKGKTSALLKAVAIDFKGAVSVAQIRNTKKEKDALKWFGVDKFPTLMLLPAVNENDGKGIKYEGDLNKAGIVEFITKETGIAPNPDPAPPKAKVKESKPKKDAKKKKDEPSPGKEEAKPSIVLEEIKDDEPLPSPDPIVDAQKPIILPPAPPIPILSTDSELGATHCLSPKSGTCVFALLPANPDEVAAQVVGSLSEIAYKHHNAKRKLFPFYALPENNPSYASFKHVLNLKGTEVIALNAKRGWWRKLPSKGENFVEQEVTEKAIENWVDAIRLGEGAKLRVPPGLIEAVPEEPEPTPEAAAEPIIIEEVKEVPTPEPVEEIKTEEAKTEEAKEPHDEL